MNLNIHQIYYHESQLPLLEFTPYNNIGKLHATFENAVIADLAESGKLFQGDLCGVLSHAWRRKSNAAFAFNPAKLDSVEADVIGFHPQYADKKMKHNPFTIGNSWHRATPQFTEILTYLLSAIGKEHDITRLPFQHNIIYSNAFLAKPEIYERYYTQYLKPALEWCEKEPLRSWLWQDCGYTKTKNARIKTELREQLGVSYYPVHPFLLERLPTVFLEQNRDVKCVHIK